MADEAAARQSRLRALVLTAILALSAWLQFTVVSQTEVDGPLRVDAGDYFSYAQNMRELGVYSIAPRWREPAAVATPDHVRPPGYPFFLRLAGVPQVSMEWLRRVAFLQAGLGVLTVGFCYLIAISFLRPPWALLATFLCGINPWLAISNTYLLSESLFTCVLFGATWLAIRATRPDAKPRLALAAGVVFAMCTLVRSTTQYFLPLLAALALLFPALRPWRRQSLLALLAFALAMAPWLVRNERLPEAPGNPDLMVLSIVHGSYADFRYQGRHETFGYPYRFDPDYEAAARDLGTALQRVADDFRSQPLEQLRWYLLGKPYFFLSLEDVQSFDIAVYPLRRTPYYARFEFAMIRMGTRAMHAPLVLSGLLAMGLLAFAPAHLRLPEEARHAANLVALLIAYAIALHMVAAPFPRYAVPFRPLLYALALLPVQAAWLAWRMRAHTGVATA